MSLDALDLLYNRFLVRFDDSDRTKSTAEYAFTVAADHEATVYVLDTTETNNRRVVRVGSDAIDCDLTTDRTNSVDRRTLIETRGSVVTESPRRTAQLADCADAYDISLTVIGTQSRCSLGEYVFGSPMERTLAATTTPTLVVDSNADAPQSYPYNSVLVLLNGSDNTMTHVRQGAVLAAQYDATLHLLSVANECVLGTSVWSNEVIDQLEKNARDAVDEATAVAADTGADDIVTAVESGSVVAKVQSYASIENIDLIVSGAHLKERLIDRIVRTVSTPVLYTHNAASG